MKRLILYKSPTSKPQAIAISSKAAIISQSVKLCDYIDTAQPCFSLSFMILLSFNLFFFPCELIIVWLMGFWDGMWRGCRTGPRLRMTPLSAVSRLWLGVSSPLNDFPGELWSWHRVRLCLLSYTDVWRLPDPSAGCPAERAVGRCCIFYHAVCE